MTRNAYDMFIHILAGKKKFQTFQTAVFRSVYIQNVTVNNTEKIVDVSQYTNSFHVLKTRVHRFLRRFLFTRKFAVYYATVHDNLTALTSENATRDVSFELLLAYVNVYWTNKQNSRIETGRGAD